METSSLLLDLKLESVEHGKAVMRMPYRAGDHQRNRRDPWRRDRQPLRFGLLRRARLDLRPRAGHDDRRADPATSSLRLALRTTSSPKRAGSKGRPPHRLRRSLRPQRRKDRRARNARLRQQLPPRKTEEGSVILSEVEGRRTALHGEHVKRGGATRSVCRVRDAGAVFEHFAASTTRCAIAPASSTSRTWGSSCFRATTVAPWADTLTINAARR